MLYVRDYWDLRVYVVWELFVECRDILIFIGEIERMWVTDKMTKQTAESVGEWLANSLWSNVKNSHRDLDFLMLSYATSFGVKIELMISQRWDFYDAM